MFLLLKYIARNGIIASHGNSMPSLLANCFPQPLCHFTFPLVYESSNFSTFSTLVIICLFDYRIIVGIKWDLTVVVICVSLRANDVKHLFLCLLSIVWFLCGFLCSKILFGSFVHL